MPAPTDSAIRWYDLPLTALRLLGAQWLPLCFWFLLQYLAGSWLLEASVKLGLWNRALGFLGLSVLIVVQLLCTIAMFQALRRNMPALARASAAADSGAAHPWSVTGGFGDSVAVALLPFFAYYASWGLLKDLTGRYAYEIWRNVGGLDLPGAFDVLDSPGLWISIVATWALRRLSYARHVHTRSPLWSVVAALCEAYWLFLAVLALSHWKGQVSGWWHSRELYVGLQAWWEAPRAWFGVSMTLKEALGPTLALAKEAIGLTILPLVWLAITAIIYGHDLRDPKTLISADARLARAHQRYSALPRLLRAAAERWSGGWRGKIVPVLNSLRFLLHAGLRPALALCVCYVALDFLCSHAFRAVASLIGPQARDVWDLILPSLVPLIGDTGHLIPSLLQEPLRICLLAAAIELSLRRLEAAPAPQYGRDDAPVPVSA